MFIIQDSRLTHTLIPDPYNWLESQNKKKLTSLCQKLNTLDTSTTALLYANFEEAVEITSTYYPSFHLFGDNVKEAFNQMIANSHT